VENNVEFVNIFIQKQKSFIEDLVAKNLVLEARISLLEGEIDTLKSQLPKSTNSKKPESTY
jgi:hypothetical protein